MIEISMTELFLFAWGAIMTALYCKLHAEHKHAEYMFGKTLYLLSKKKVILVDDGDGCHLEEVNE